MNTVTAKKSFAYKMITILAAIAASVILPQLFHAIGAISGTGSAVGAALLPMHIPVILAGFIGGPAVGLIAGLFSPLVSFAISSMPTAALLPFITIELAAYGFGAGLISKTKLNSFAKLVIIQLAGRAARALAILAAVYVLGNTSLSAASIVEFITAGLFGIILQWAFIPFAVNKIGEKASI
ncbi:MAG: ECF transporter S component [Oscillospiraceae bacterium]|nr:ECF transporter S component [Oscillospiraceae bacterium]